MDELLPCPFCGGAVVMMLGIIYDFYCPHCQKGFAVMALMWQIRKRIKAWNTRKEEPSHEEGGRG